MVTVGSAAFLEHRKDWYGYAVKKDLRRCPERSLTKKPTPGRFFKPMTLSFLIGFLFYPEDGGPGSSKILLIIYHHPQTQ
jgi:hypothetical protein